MKLPWGFRRRRVRTRVVRTRLAVTRCSAKRRRRLSPSRRIARAALGMGASVRKAPSQGSSPSPVHGRRKPRRRSWRLGAPKPSPNPRRLWASGGRGRRGRPGRRDGPDCRPGGRRDRGRERGGTRRRERGAGNGRGQAPAASLCAQGRDRGRPYDGGRGGGDRGSELAACFASAGGGGAGHARGSADEGDGAVRRVGDGSAEGGA